MKFGTFLLRVDGVREAEIEDFGFVKEVSQRIYAPDTQKFLYEVDNEIIDNRFYWMSCDYDDAAKFRDYVVNNKTGAREPNPRSKSQIEPRQQFFACYDTEKHYLYVSDLSKRNFLQSYLTNSAQRDFQINNVYTSVEEFCSRIKSIRGFKFTQVNNLFSRSGEVFNQVGDMWGLDAPNSIQLKVSYGDIPVREGKALVDRFHRDRAQFENVVIIGCDDDGIEQTFDFSSVIKRIQIKPCKDENEHYNPQEVKDMLLQELR